MLAFRFCFLNEHGQIAAETKLGASTGEEALEIAGLLKHPFGVRVYLDDLEVGTALPQIKTSL